MTIVRMIRSNADIERHALVAELKSRVMSNSRLRSQLMIDQRAGKANREGRVDRLELQVLNPFVVNRFLGEEDHHQASSDRRGRADPEWSRNDVMQDWGAHDHDQPSRLTVELFIVRCP
jgi:hypothetical protein